MSHSRISHWREVSPNPVSAEVQLFLKRRLADCYGGPRLDPTKLYPELFAGKKVLDIGVVEHTREFYFRPGWRHRLIKEVAKEVVGIDVIEEQIAFLASEGFDVRTVDGTSGIDMHERFDSINIGDVMEHVERPVDMLRFAARHLKDGGLIFVTTPCPYWYESLIPVVFGKHAAQNADHISWIVPAHALELAHRAGLRLERYHLFQPDGMKLHLRLLHLIRKRVLPYCEVFAWAYGYIFRKSEPA